jgi:hypothetical protein
MSVRVVLAALALAPAPRLEPAEVLEIAEQSDERDRLVSPARAKAVVMTTATPRAASTR